KLQSNMAILSRMMGNPEQAIEPLLNATALARKLSEQSGQTPETSFAISLNEFSLSQCYFDTGEIDDGLAAIRRGIANTRETLDQYPDFLPARTHQVDEFTSLCDLLLEQDPVDESAFLQHAKTAVAISSKVIEDFDDLMEYQVRHAVVLSTLADANTRQGDFLDGARIADSAISHLNTVLRVDPAAKLDVDAMPEDAVNAYFYNYYALAGALSSQLRMINADETFVVSADERAQLVDRRSKAIAACQALGATPEEIDSLKLYQ
ncbi:MAG: hypothetical protein AAFP90_12480, partial [Planctomycetota bacterium]